MSDHPTSDPMPADETAPAEAADTDHHGVLARGLARYLRSDEREAGKGFVSLMFSVGSALSVGALVGITLNVGWHSLWRVVENANWLFALLVPVAVAVSYLGYALAYREVAESEHCTLGLRDALRIVATGFGPLSPRGGFALDVRELIRRGLDRDTARHRVRVLGMLEYAVLAPVTLAAAAYMLARGIRAESSLVPSWVIGVPAGALVTVALAVRYSRAGRPQTWWAPLRRYLDSIHGLAALLRSWRRTPKALAGMALYWAAEMAALGGCVDVFGHRKHAVVVLIVAYASGYALARRALPLAGAGVVEALMPLALTWVGYSLASSLLAVVAYRICNLWLASIPAAMSFRHLERKHLRARSTLPAA